MIATVSPVFLVFSVKPSRQLHTSPFLTAKLHAPTLIDREFALKAMANHVVLHPGVLGARPRLVDDVAHCDGLVAGDHPLPLAQVYLPDAGGDLRSLVGAVGRGRGMPSREDGGYR